MASEHRSPASEHILLHAWFNREIFQGEKIPICAKRDFRFEEIDDIGAVNDAQLEQSHLLRNVAVQGVIPTVLVMPAKARLSRHLGVCLANVTVATHCSA